MIEEWKSRVYGYFYLRRAAPLLRPQRKSRNVEVLEHGHAAKGARQVREVLAALREMRPAMAMEAIQIIAVRRPAGYLG